VTTTSWPWPTPELRRARDEQIMELYAMGLDRRAIARRFDLTPDRISQIVLSYGGRFR